MLFLRLARSVAQFCVNNWGGGGDDILARRRQFLGGIQATISHSAKFGEGPSPPRELRLWARLLTHTKTIDRNKLASIEIVNKNALIYYYILLSYHFY